MSRIARKLCEEIEAPLTNIRAYDYKKTFQNACNYDNKTKRSVLVEKHKSIIPHEYGTNRIKFRTEETVIDKTCIDSAVNTNISGQLQDSNDCASLLHRRVTNKCVCKLSNKYSKLNRVSSKQIQTFDVKVYSFSDKACYHCAETSSRGTQFRCSSPKLRSQDQLDSDSHDSSRRSIKIVIKPPINYPRSLPESISKKDRLKKSDDVTKTVLRPPEQRKSEIRLKQKDESEPDLRFRVTEGKKTGRLKPEVEKLTRQPEVKKRFYRQPEKEIKKSNNKIGRQEVKQSDSRMERPAIKKSNQRFEKTEINKSDHKLRHDIRKTDLGYAEAESLKYRLKEEIDSNSNYPYVRNIESIQPEPRKSAMRQLEPRRREFKELEATRAEYKKPETQKARLDLRLANLARDSRQQDMDRNSSRLPSVNFMGARRWSLSQYTARGPDF